MTVYNLYFYHCINDVSKILKFRTPMSLYSLFNLSNRVGKETLIILPKSSNSYIRRSAAIWNTVRNHLSLNAFTFKPNTLKSQIKVAILNAQSEGEPMEWNLTLNSLQQNSKILTLNLSTQENKQTITSSTGRK